MNNINNIGIKCYGCRACENVCPHKAIKFDFNSEGFLFPLVNDHCVNCGLCLKKCPALKNEIYSNPISFYGFINNDKDELIKSSSGGFAQVLSKYVINNGGFVAGCIYGEDFIPKHIITNKLDDLKLMQTSKYAQSTFLDSFSDIKNILESGNQLLIIGTPCQIHAVKMFLCKEYENLITVDLVCHGVPSPILLKEYIKYLEAEGKSKVVSFNFRYKKNDLWGDKYVKYVTENGKEHIELIELDKYGEDFVRSNNFRESCYSCKYSNINKRCSDITIGDLWGINEVDCKFNFDNGVSGVIINTNKGANIFENIKHLANTFEITKDQMLLKQTNLIEPTKRGCARDEYYLKMPLDYFGNKKVKNIKAQLKKVIPFKVRKLLKRITNK